VKFVRVKEAILSADMCIYFR